MYNTLIKFSIFLKQMLLSFIWRHVKPRAAYKVNNKKACICNKKMNKKGLCQIFLFINFIIVYFVFLSELILCGVLTEMNKHDLFYTTGNPININFRYLKSQVC